MAKELKTMTVGELIQALQSYDKNMPVVASYPSGDHWRTVLVKRLNDESMEEQYIRYTTYHDKFQVTESSDDDDNNWKDSILALVL